MSPVLLAACGSARQHGSACLLPAALRGAPHTLLRRSAAPAPRGPPPAVPPRTRRHAFCRQRQDARLRRGCEQRSVVVLSFLPLPSLLEPLARLVGPAALSYGPGTLQEVRAGVVLLCMGGAERERCGKPPA